MSKNITRSLMIFKLSIIFAFLLYVFFMQDFSKIVELLLDAKYEYLVVYTLLYALAIFMYSINYSILLRPMGYKVSLKKLLYYDVLGLGGTYFTPGGLGGVGIMIYMLRREGVTLKDASLVVLIDKIVTALVAAVLCVGAFYKVLPWEALLPNPSIMLFSLPCVAAGMILMYQSTWLRKQLAKLSPYANFIKRYTYCILLNALVTIFILFLSTFQYITAFEAIGEHLVNYFLMLTFYSVIIIINYLPISVGGIGVAEMTGVYMWSTLGVDSEAVLAAFAILRMYTLISTIFLTGLAMIIWFSSKNKIEEAAV